MAEVGALDIKTCYLQRRVVVGKVLVSKMKFLCSACFFQWDREITREEKGLDGTKEKNPPRTRKDGRMYLPGGDRTVCLLLTLLCIGSAEYTQNQNSLWKQGVYARPVPS